MVKYCFSGFLNGAENAESSLWERVKQEYQELQTAEVKANADSREEAARLNNLDSRYWLLIAVLELLANGDPNFNSNLQIIESIFSLKKQRSFLLKELRPLKQTYYPNLAKLQKHTRFIQKIINQILETPLERDYQLIKKILEKLVKYIIINSYSKNSYEELLKVFKKEWENNQSYITPSSLVLLYEIQRLLTWMSPKKTNLRANRSKVTSKLIGDISKKKYHFKEGCEHWKALMYDLITKSAEDRKILGFSPIMMIQS